MPRRNRPGRRPAPPGRPSARPSAGPSGGSSDESSGGPPLLGGWLRHEEHGGERWAVRAVSGSAATKPYRCPGCQQLIPPGTPHVVAWPERDDADGGAERRHWHTGCWRR